MSAKEAFQKPLRIKGRLRLTTKQVNGGYYKGNRTGSMGFFGPKKGEYIIDYRKVRTYNYPAKHMQHFTLTPFVTKEMHPTASKYTKHNPNEKSRDEGFIFKYRRMTGTDYLEEWARRNEPEYNHFVHGTPLPVADAAPAVSETGQAETVAETARATATETQAQAQSQSQSQRQTQPEKA